MAKINVIGDAVVITSTLKTEDIALVQKYRPEALTLRKEVAGCEEVYFKIGTTTGAGSVNQYGVSFGGTSRDGGGFATVTLTYSGPTDKVKEYLADTYGTALFNLNAVEEAVPAVLEEIATQKAAVIAAITVG